MAKYHKLAPALDELTDGDLIKRYRIIRQIKRIDESYVPEGSEKP